MSAELESILNAYRLLDGPGRRRLAAEFPRLSAVIQRAGAAQDEEHYREQVQLRKEYLRRKVATLRSEGSHVPSWMIEETLAR